MKKFISLILLLSTLFLFGCSDYNIDTVDESTSNKSSENNAVILPNDDTVIVQKTSILTPVKFDNFSIVDIISDFYYGYKSISANNNINNEFAVINTNTGKETKLENQNSFSDFVAGSGYNVVLNNRYIYEWRGFSSNESDSEYLVKLLRIDCNSGNIAVIDEVKSTTPLIYTYKINEKEFLSYSLSQTDSSNTEYAVVSKAWIYDIEGNGREIINEKYENDASWENSNGLLIEKFFVKNEIIYGFGRRMINQQYKFFLYQYSHEGVLENETEIKNFDKILGDEQPLEMHFIGDYLALRTYESMTTYICKLKENNAVLIMKGLDHQVYFTVSGDYIFFIENNINVYDGKIMSGSYPLYYIDTKNDSIYKHKISVDLKPPYFVDVQSMSNGSILFTYSDGENYDPLKLKQFIFSLEK